MGSRTRAKSPGISRPSVFGKIIRRVSEPVAGFRRLSLDST